MSLKVGDLVEVRLNHMRYGVIISICEEKPFKYKVQCITDDRKQFHYANFELIKITDMDLINKLNKIRIFK
jgi:hypothetical protein